MKNNPGLSHPAVREASLQICDSEWAEIQCLELEPSCEIFLLAKRQFTMEGLRAMAVEHGFNVRLRVVIDRSYFSLASIIDLEKTSTVSEDTRRVVETILRGEKPAGSDFYITGGWNGDGSGDASCTYYMHRQSLANTSSLFRVIHIAHGLEAPLPYDIESDRIDLFRGLFRSTSTMSSVLNGSVPSALALEIRDPSSSSMVELLRLLNIIWKSEYGWFPVAKRVVIGRLADMVHLNARTSLLQFVQHVLLPLFGEAGIKAVHVPSILTPLTKHLRMVPSVRKRAVAGLTEEVEEEKEGEQSWHDVESGHVEAPNEGRHSFTIS